MPDPELILTPTDTNGWYQLDTSKQSIPICPYPTVADVREFLDGFGLGTANFGVKDTWLQGRIDAAMVLMEDWLRTSFRGKREAFETYSGNDSEILVLQRRPVIELISISYSNISVNTYIAKYILEPIEGIVRGFSKRDIFPRGRDNIAARYTYGYDGVPIDLKESCLALITDRMLGQLANQSGGGDLSVEAYSRSFGDRGRYTNMRNDLGRIFRSGFNRYKTGI